MPGVEDDLIEACLVELIDRNARIWIAGRGSVWGSDAPESGKLALYGDFFTVDLPARDETYETIVPFVGDPHNPQHGAIAMVSLKKTTVLC